MVTNLQRAYANCDVDYLRYMVKTGQLLEEDFRTYMRAINNAKGERSKVGKTITWTKREPNGSVSTMVEVMEQSRYLLIG